MLQATKHQGTRSRTNNNYYRGDWQLVTSIGPASASIQQGQLANLTRPTNQAGSLAVKIALSPPCSVVVGPKSQQAELVV